MPKPSKTNSKQKPKPKRKAEPEVAGITTRKSYWLMPGVLLTFVSAVFGLINGLDTLKIGLLITAVVVPISCLGFVRVSSSSLSVSKRATFLFAGHPLSVLVFGPPLLLP
jgi:hypothetical protein